MMTDGAYKWVKVSGLLALIPLVLAAGPVTGYMAGDWIAARFNLPRYVTIIFISLGFAASVQETVKIIKAALRAAKNAE